MTRAKRLLVRCDADERIGLGHAGRALALAEELSARLGTPPAFVARPTALLTGFLAKRGVRVLELASAGYGLSELAPLLGPGTVLVTDSYDLTAGDLAAVAETRARHVVVDDFARLASWPVDVVVNPNVGAPVGYAGARAVLLGERYALVRREVRKAAARRDDGGGGAGVLVSLGGGALPPGGAQLLERLAALEADVRATVPAALAPAGVTPVTRAALADELAGSALGVLSGGVVKYEAAVCGLPSLLVAVVDHQERVAEAFAATGAASYAGRLSAARSADVADAAARLLADRAKRAALSRRAREVVDGRGAERVAEVFSALRA